MNVSRNKQKKEILDYLAKTVGEMGPGHKGIEEAQLKSIFSKKWDCSHSYVNEIIDELDESGDLQRKGSLVWHSMYRGPEREG